ncbi:phosphotransferase family protein [Paenibacillus agri]|uniref:Phosphotransferase n=1 Tax=Paenibacillus agri TaxID=2744309 RepID=A0A850EJY4_9BACL|nr:aminoglycoside phosphotransferase family protein [Paenibacillus agri]NUU61673.1 phosphotransferase [Paenibacillus agri]
MKGKLVGEGRTAEIWEYGDRKVLKLYREGIPADQVTKEYSISVYAHTLGIRTPQPIELAEVEGRSGIVFQQIEGSSVLTLLGKSPWKVGQYARKLAKLHYDLHTLDAGEDLGVQKERLKWSIHEAPLLNESEKQAILSYLDTLPVGGKLCHGDFHPDNILMDGQVWIIDWMTGLAGDPAGDAARSVVMFSMGVVPEGTPAIAKLVIGFIRKRLTKDYLREYLKLSGQTREEIERWILPVAAARLTEWLPVAEKEQLVREIRKRLATLTAG